MLPFGNQSATATMNGVTLKEFLETAVSPLPATGNGRFGQVSGLCVEFNIEAPAKQFDATGSRHPRDRKPRHEGRAAGGRRNVRLRRRDARRSRRRRAPTRVTINDFMMTGGDGYPNVRTTAATQDMLDQDVADYLATLPGSQVTPTIQHRVHCTDPNPGSGNNCPPARRRRTGLEREPAASRGGLPLPALRRRAASRRSRPPASHALVPPSVLGVCVRRVAEEAGDREALPVGAGRARAS